jgi:hypothetical protein
MAYCLLFYSIKLLQYIDAELGVSRVHDVWHDLGEPSFITNICGIIVCARYKTMTQGVWLTCY